MALKETRPQFTIRTHRPGDLGYIVFRHGAVYGEEYKHGPEFEAIVARIAADFLDNFDERRDRCWIAERAGTFLGCVMLVQDPSDPNTAKLRVLLVEAAARGLGVGRALVKGCVAFATEAGYRRIELFTTSNLISARKLYAAEGFRMVCRDPELPTFVPGSIGERWELKVAVEMDKTAGDEKEMLTTF